MVLKGDQCLSFQSCAYVGRRRSEAIRANLSSAACKPSTISTAITSEAGRLLGRSYPSLCEPAVVEFVNPLKEPIKLLT